VRHHRVVQRHVVRVVRTHGAARQVRRARRPQRAASAARAAPADPDPPPAGRDEHKSRTVTELNRQAIWLLAREVRALKAESAEIRFTHRLARGVVDGMSEGRR
jgi:hypothetical protein